MARSRKPSGREPRERAISSYYRIRGNLKPRERILIVCEGEKTEPNYFRAICIQYRLTSVRVMIEGEECPNDALHIVEHAISRKKQNPEFDEVWCVMDVENPLENPNFPRAVSKAYSSRGIEVAASNPAFEYWLLLHFVETSRPFANCDEVIRILRKHVPKYDKNMRRFNSFFDKTEIAIERAVKILRSHPESSIAPNPSTRVYKLVDKLKKMMPKY